MRLLRSWGSGCINRVIEVYETLCHLPRLCDRELLVVLLPVDFSEPLKIIVAHLHRSVMLSDY